MLGEGVSLPKPLPPPRVVMEREADWVREWVCELDAVEVGEMSNIVPVGYKEEEGLRDRDGAPEADPEPWAKLLEGVPEGVKVEVGHMDIVPVADTVFENRQGEADMTIVNVRETLGEAEMLPGRLFDGV